eukprot:COSAG01_NODE_3335_length_6237_cov_5.928315_6_plen_78_part_00
MCELMIRIRSSRRPADSCWLHAAAAPASAALRAAAASCHGGRGSSLRYTVRCLLAASAMHLPSRNSSEQQQPRGWGC